ncbi:hypothetical protein IMSHALPRED_000740 [Imshaugia aleurites]|uniref:Galactose oxidase n=1 Tax=Imshaugia aleurites TaxID=172621 RepID=A0A8H3IS44_9LECA|nr:hypothetical protein IMSHALPRED_000740 [Imshaugia aleurites]
MDPATVSGLVVAEQVVSTTVEGGAIAAYGLAQSTQPLSATFKRISSPAFLPRSNHSLTVLAGRAYIFGGEDENGKLAGDEVHIVTLPLKKKGNHDGEVDYKCVPSLGEGEDGKVPRSRVGHVAVAIRERIYLFGGKGEDGEAIEEMGRVWVFDTNTLGWSYIDPASDTSTTSVPQARYHHGAASSEHPLPQTNASSKASYSEQITSTIAKLPSLMTKTSSPQEPHGSLIICSGLSSPSSPLNDTWLFNIPTRTWSALPSTPAISPSPPSMALTYNRLYLITSTSNLGSEIHYLPITKETYTDARGEGELGLSTSKPEWTTLPFPTNPLTPGPRPRKGAGLVPVTTGNGREYLLYFLGEKAATTPPATTAEKEELQPEKTDPTFWSDTYSYQVPAVPITAAGIKDATRQAMGIATGEDTWAEVRVDAGVESAEKEGDGKAHPGPRGWFASAPVPGMQGGVVLWGGVNGKGETEGDGWLLDVGSAR